MHIEAAHCHTAYHIEVIEPFEAHVNVNRTEPAHV